MRRSIVGLAIGVFVGGAAFAQYVISAHSGVVQLVEGRAYLNDTLLEGKFGQFPDIKENQEFRTEEGRAEILLTPGVFLRIGANSAIKMLSTRLTDTRVEILRGSAIVECEEIPKDNAITLVHNGDTLLLVKHGLYRIDSDPARFRVYDGEAIVKAESGQLTLRSGKETSLGDALMAAGFDKNDTDALYNWSSRRAGYVAQANASSATAMNSGGGYFSNGFFNSALLGGFGGLGGWQYNSMFGLYTWVPYQGMYSSPFGYSFFSPATVAFYSPVVAGGYSAGRTPVPVSTGSAFARATSARSAPSGGIGGGARGFSSAGGGHGGHGR
jgi:hypothetical protein